MLANITTRHLNLNLQIPKIMAEKSMEVRGFAITLLMVQGATMSMTDSQHDISTITTFRNSLLTKYGILIHQPEPTRKIIGYYNILVTLKAPIEPDIETTIQNVERQLQSVDTVADSTREDWRISLQEIRLIHSFARSMLVSPHDNLETTNRKKRAALSFVGDLIHDLFGLSTDATVESLQNVVQNLNLRVETVWHNSEDYYSIINSTAAFAQENSLAITNLQENVKNISNDIQKLQNEINSVNEKWRIRHEIKFFISRLHATAMQYQRWATRFHRARTVLENAALNDDVLPETVLQEIAANIREDTPSALWCYRYAHLDYLSTNPHSVIYRIAIPLISEVPFDTYKFTFFSTQYTENITKRLDAPKAMSPDTATGEFFFTEDAKCYGRNPVLCAAAGIYTGSNCLKDIVMTGSVKECTFLFENKPQELVVHRLHGQYIAIITHKPIKMQVTCEGERPQLRLLAGPELISLRPKCTLRLGDITIDAYASMTSNTTLSFSPRFLNISESSEGINKSMLKKLVMHRFNFGDSTKIRLGTAQKLHLRPLPPTLTPAIHIKNVATANIVTAFIVLLIVAASAAALYKAFKWQKTRRKSDSINHSIVQYKASKTRSNSNHSTGTIADRHIGSQQELNPAFAPVYPILPEPDD